MQIIQRSSSKRFDLPENTTLSIELTNPYFSHSGSFTLPITLPDTINNRTLLGYANRLDLAHEDDNGNWSRQIDLTHEVILILGSWQQIGTLTLLSYSDEGYECSILLGESSIYEQLRNLTLKDIFKDVVWHPTTGRTTKDKAAQYASVKATVDALEEKLDYNGNFLNEDFAVFPLIIDNVGIINDVYMKDGKPAFFADSSVYHIGDHYVKFDRSSGLGFTAFLRLRTVLELIFQYIGRTLTIDFPDEIDNVDFSQLWQRIVILNSTIDTCAPGMIFYDTLVPDMPVLDFIQNLFAMFSAGFFEISSTEVKMCFMSETLDTYQPLQIEALVQNIEYQDDTHLQLAFSHIRGDDDRDITDLASLDSKYIIPDEIKCDVDVDDISQNLYDQVKPALEDAEMNELVRLHDRGRITYVGDAPGSDPSYLHICYDQLDIIAPANANTEDIENTISDTHLGQMYAVQYQDIDDSGNTMPLRWLSAHDIYAPQLLQLSAETTQLKVYVTEIDSSGNTSRSTVEIERMTGKPLVFCYAGAAQSFPSFNIMMQAISSVRSTFATPYYIFDTDAALHQCLDLTTQGLPKTMHAPWQRALHEGWHTLTCTALMTTQQALSLDFSVPVLINNHKCLIQTIRLTADDKPLQQVELTLKII